MAAVPGIYYEIIACCPDFGTQITFFNSINGTILDGTYSYEGTTTVINGIQFRNGYCYTIIRRGVSFQNYPDIDYNFLNPIVDGCTDPKCPTCPTYYTLNDCCSNEPYKVEGDIVYIAYTNECEPGVCPTNLENLVITEILNEVELPATGCFNLTEVTLPALANTIYRWEIFVQEVSTVPTCADCQECCYTLTNCETNEVIYSNSNTLIQHFGNIVTLNGQEGCWAVALSEGDCTCPIPVTVLQSFEDCPSCVPIIAYKFTNCNNQTLVQYSTEDYSEYVGKTVELECGDCWFVSQIDYTPPSTQTITILYTFDNCAACAKTYYELTNCLNETQLIYTSSTITLNPIDPTNCECIKVTWVINNQTVILETLYQASVPGYQFSLGGIQIFKIIWNDDTEVWDLFFGTIVNVELIGTLDNSSNCPFGNFVINSTGIEKNITSLFVEPCTPDTIISIKECAGCWIVKETREPINPGVVEVTETYIDCPECLETFPCVCNRITNQDTIAKDFTYLDCSFEEVTINLQPNETSDKVCLVNWVLTPEEEALVYIEHFGDCINGQCPVEPLPKRKVKPGYSTPSCDIEKYEKITCKSSEIYYKQVMRLRYGISNCCPEDEEKWLVKKELIDLDALRDPDYICTPVTTCCNQPISSCGCGCNQTLKTCNS